MSTISPTNNNSSGLGGGRFSGRRMRQSSNTSCGRDSVDNQSKKASDSGRKSQNYKVMPSTKLPIKAALQN
jgi:hypothetical protein